jgi:predicted nuclease of restriction endonuclease-like (RecB) superfamily
LRISPKIFALNFLVLPASPLLTFGESNSLRSLRQGRKTRTIGARNQLDEESGDPGAVQGPCAERQFYLERTKQFGWTKNVLIHQIENKTVEKTLLNQTNFEVALPEHIRNQAKLAVKDEYTFDFLELADEHSERQLEQAILARVEPFLLEMGGMFSSVGSQYRLEVGGKEYFIDLLLFHRRLRLLVAIDLKIGEFQPEHVGKMQFYLAILDDTVRLEGENSSIGILICKSKDRTIVEYALKESSKPIGVATYRMVTSVPNELRNDLPTPEQISKLLDE